MFGFFKKKEQVRTNKDFIAPETHTDHVSPASASEVPAPVLVTKAAQNSLEKVTDGKQGKYAVGKEAAARRKEVRSLVTHKNPATGKRHTIAEVVKITGYPETTVRRYAKAKNA